MSLSRDSFPLVVLHVVFKSGTCKDYACSLFLARGSRPMSPEPKLHLVALRSLDMALPSLDPVFQ